MVFCPKCGKEIKEGELFCSDCGHRLNVELDNETPALPKDESMSKKIDSTSSQSKSASTTPTMVDFVFYFLGGIIAFVGLFGALSFANNRTIITLLIGILIGISTSLIKNIKKAKIKDKTIATDSEPEKNKAKPTTIIFLAVITLMFFLIGLLKDSLLAIIIAVMITIVSVVLYQIVFDIKPKWLKIAAATTAFICIGSFSVKNISANIKEKIQIKQAEEKEKAEDDEIEAKPTQEYTTEVTTTENTTSHKYNITIDTSKLIEIDPCNIQINTFVSNFNTVTTELFKSQFNDYGISTDLLLLKEGEIEKDVKFAINDKHNIYHYYFCDELFEVVIRENINNPNIVYSCLVTFKDREINAATDNAKTILSDEKLVAEILSSMFVFICDLDSLDKLDEFIENVDFRWQYSEKNNAFLPYSVDIYEKSHEKYKSSSAHYMGGSVKTDESTTSDNTTKLTDDDLDRIDKALKATSFPLDNSVSLKKIITDTFKDYTIDGVLTASDSSIGYYEYTATVTGNYYANTAAKASNTTSKGTIHYTIMYMQNSVSVCTVAVDDVNGDVYKAMSNILFNM